MQSDFSLVLSDALFDQMAAEARTALPRECCGLVEGVRESGIVRVVALHPTANLETADDCFEIDPAKHVRLVRALRGTGREIVGCYHSHPRGRCVPSARDLAQAAQEDFVWLIAAPRDEGFSLGAFIFRAGAFHSLELIQEPIAA